MSLITEALKTAQREKAERGGPSMERKLLEGFFPYSGGGDAPENRRTMLWVGAGVAVLLAAAGGGALYLRRASAAPSVPPHASTPAATAPLIKAPVNPSQPVVQAGNSKSSAVGVAKQPVSGKPQPESSNAAISATTLPAPIEHPRAAARRQAVSQVSIPISRDSSPPRIAQEAAPTAAVPPSNVTVSASAPRAGDQLFADAYAAQQAGNLDRAQELYEKAIQTPPVSADVFNNYGALLVQRGDVDGAIRMYRRALAIDHDNVKAWINLGAALDQNGIHAEATSAFEQVLKLDANNVPVKLKLADQYQALGDSASAKRLISEAIRIAPKDPMAHYEMAALLERQRDIAGALREYDAFLEFGANAFSADQLDQIRRHEVTLRGRRQ